jgi:hypothetical protein
MMNAIMSGYGKGMSKNSHYKRSFLMLLVVLACLTGGTMAIVDYFDPLCCNGAVRKYNRVIPIIDARLQKTNMLIRSKNSYDALLIGSSRPEQFKQEDFLPLHVFNYSAPSMYPDEYEAYIDLFLKYNDRRPKVIFLGLDFYGTNLKMHKHARPPDYYIKSCSSPFTWRNLLSIDSLKYALRMACGTRDLFNYDRKTLDKLTQHPSREVSDRQYKRDITGFSELFYGDYVYNPNYRQALRALKERYGQTKFVVFTTPETMQLFQILVSKGRLGDYERWLNDIVDVFGSAYNFMMPTPLSMDRNNFFDAQHLYPDKATPIVHMISGAYEPRRSEFGYLITDEKSIKDQMAKIYQTFPVSGDKSAR